METKTMLSLDSDGTSFGTISQGEAISNEISTNIERGTVIGEVNDAVENVVEMHL